MDISIRKFEENDIINKIKWINDPLNNKYLHYDIPLKLSNTREWFRKNKDNTKRFDGVIEVNGVAVGLIGLLSIDVKLNSAEYYILIGERAYLGKGVAKRASALLLGKAFRELNLERIYLSTESKNTAGQYLYESLGFTKICNKANVDGENLIQYEMFKDDYYD